MDNGLDDAERAALEMIEFFQNECRKQCAPYVEILANIRSFRPRSYVVDGKTFVPIDAASTSAGSNTPANAP